MANTLTEWQTTLGCPSRTSRSSARSPIHGLSGNVYFNGVLAERHGDILIRVSWVPLWQSAAPLLDIERENSSTTAANDFRHMPTLYLGRQLHDAPT